MMQNFLFRGKTKDTNKWVYGPLAMFHSSKEDKYVYHIQEFFGDTNSGYIAKEVIPETVGQYTGITDKTGEKIFVGDILEIYRYSVFCGRVVFENGCFGVVEWKYQDFLPMYSIQNLSIKIIGDVYK